MNCPSWVRFVAARVDWAIPRSMMRSRWSLVSIRLSGLMSRCTIPASWMAARPSAAWCASSRSKASGIVFHVSRIAESVRPCTRSRTR